MIVINDFVVNEQICNMKCRYCLTITSAFKDPVEKLASQELKYGVDTGLAHRMDAVTNYIRNAFQPSILKVSGGEIFLIKGFMDYVRKHARFYDVIQILTNGVLLDKVCIDQLKEVKNLCLQLSLDHHQLEGNSYRTPSEQKLQRILSNLDAVVDAGIPLEINCVLHDRNTLILPEFVHYLHQRYSGKIMILPFPVRGHARKEFSPTPNQWRGVEKILSQYEVYQTVLPPKVYFEHLLRFLEGGNRSVKCVLPKLALGTFDDGNITPCANYWFTSLGNLFTDRPQLILEKVNRHPVYNRLLDGRFRFEECKGCFTPWDIINLHAQGDISLEELQKSPLYSFGNTAHLIHHACKSDGTF